MNTREQLDALYYVALDADRVFHVACVKQFGPKHCGDGRYASEKHNAETAAACEAFHKATQARLDAIHADRAESEEVRA